MGSTQPLKVSREVVKEHLSKAATREKSRFDALERAGFRVARNAVLSDWIYLRGGGYYIDVGTSARIVSGEIKVKSGVPIKRFVQKGLEMEDGELLDADIVVFATGYQRDPRLQATGVVGREVAKNMRVSKGLDQDGELEGYMMPAGELKLWSIAPERAKMRVGRALWLLGGAAEHARFNSRFIALQIRAELLGMPFPDCRWKEGKTIHEKALKL